MPPTPTKASDAEVLAAAARVEAGELSQRAAARELGYSSNAGFANRLKTLRKRADGLSLSSSSDPAGAYEEIPVIRRRYDADHHYVYPLGDVHIGATAHHADAWQEWLDYLVEHENTSMVGTGDFLNTAIIGSVSDVYEETLAPRDARRLLKSQLEPLAAAERIDVLIPGNHEDRIAKSVGDCPIEIIAEMLEVPYAPAATLIVYEIGDVEYKVFVRHGTGNGQSTVAIEKAQAVIDADVYISGHTHAQIVKAGEVFELAPDGSRTQRRRVLYVSSGSFMGLEKYAAQRGYRPTRIGAPRIYLDGVRKDVHGSI